jgi:hypothetical protein
MLGKCVFIMPPRTRRFDWNTRWQRAREVLAEHGLNLPFYHARGLLFTLDDEGRVDSAAVFPLGWRWILRRSISRMLRRNPLKGVSAEQTVHRALRKSRVTWLLWRMPLSIISAAIIIFFAVAVAIIPVLGRGPRPLAEPPDWHRFKERFYVAMELENAHTGMDNLEISARRRMKGKAKQDFVRAGLPFVPDAELLNYIKNFSHALSRTDKQTCAQVVGGGPDEISTIRMLVNLPEGVAQRFTRTSFTAAVAALSSTAVIGTADFPPEVYAELTRVLGPETTKRLILLRISRSSVEMTFAGSNSS